MDETGEQVGKRALERSEKHEEDRRLAADQPFVKAINEHGLAGEAHLPNANWSASSLRPAFGENGVRGRATKGADETGGGFVPEHECQADADENRAGTARRSSRRRQA
jgi:hypothetical protein